MTTWRCQDTIPEHLNFQDNNVNLFGPANGELLERLSVIPESKGESQKEGFCIWQPGASGAVLSRVSDGRGYLY